MDLERAYESVKAFLHRQGSPRILGSFEEFSKRYREDESLQKVVDDIFGVEQEINSAMAPRHELERIISQLYTGNKAVSFSDRAVTVEDLHGNQIGLASLSSGEKHLVRMLIESLLIDMSSILIDEPELSLHIDWQRDLVRTFRTLNPKGQFILATHSPEIMADIPDERIFTL
jgi:predicted ATP-dependent endonuclease of OLD family